MSMPYSLFNTRSATDAGTPDKQGVAVSGTTTYYSDIWTGEDADGYALTCIYSGTPTGTLTLWVSDKPLPILTDDTEWVQDTGFAPTNPAGAAGKFRDDAANSKGYRKRLKYVNASGAGTLNAFVTIPRF